MKLYIARHGEADEDGFGWISLKNSEGLPADLEKELRKEIAKGKRTIPTGGWDEDSQSHWTGTKTVTPQKDFWAFVQDVLSDFVGDDEARYYVVRTEKGG